MTQRQRTHPGEVLREEFLDSASMSVEQLAIALDVPPATITEIVACRAPVTIPLALRLAKYFGGDGRFWINLQVGHDFSVAESNIDLSAVKPRNPDPVRFDVLVESLENHHPTDGEDDTTPTDDANTDQGPEKPKLLLQLSYLSGQLHKLVEKSQNLPIKPVKQENLVELKAALDAIYGMAEWHMQKSDTSLAAIVLAGTQMLIDVLVPPKPNDRTIEALEQSRLTDETPRRCRNKKRITIEEMLAGCDFSIPLTPEAQADQDAWMNMPSVGQEWGSAEWFAENEPDSEEGKEARALKK